MTFDINAIKIGDKVGIGNITRPALAYGVIQKVRINSTHVEYLVEIHSTARPQLIRLHSMNWFRHTQLRREDNEPDVIMKSII